MFLRNFVNCLEIFEKFAGNSEYTLCTFVTLSGNIYTNFKSENAEKIFWKILRVLNKL